MPPAFALSQDQTLHLNIHHRNPKKGRGHMHLNAQSLTWNNRSDVRADRPVRRIPQSDVDGRQTPSIFRASDLHPDSRDNAGRVGGRPAGHAKNARRTPIAVKHRRHMGFPASKAIAQDLRNRPHPRGSPNCSLAKESPGEPGHQSDLYPRAEACQVRRYDTSRAGRTRTKPPSLSCPSPSARLGSANDNRLHSPNLPTTALRCPPAKDTVTCHMSSPGPPVSRKRHIALGRHLRPSADPRVGAIAPCRHSSTPNRHARRRHED